MNHKSLKNRIRIISCEANRLPLSFQPLTCQLFGGAFLAHKTGFIAVAGKIHVKKTHGVHIGTLAGPTDSSPKREAEPII